MDSERKKQPDEVTPEGRLVLAVRAIRVITDRRYRFLLLVGGIAMFGLLSMVMAFVMITQSDPIEEDSLASALIELKAGRHETARELAEQMASRDGLSPEELGGPSFILGTVTLHEAKHAWGESGKKKLYLLAARYLEKAHDLGFPEGTRAEGLYYLGVSLFQSGRYDECLPVLEQSLELDISQRTEVFRMLAEAHLSRDNPDYAIAREWSRRYLQQEDLTSAEHDAGYLQLCEILLQIKDRQGALDALGQVPGDTSRRAEAMVYLGRIQMLTAAEALEDQQLREQGTHEETAAASFHEAIDIFEEASRNDTLAANARRKSAYFTGIAYRKLGEMVEARDQFLSTCKLFTETPEGYAARLELAEVRLELGEADQAFADLRELLRETPRPQEFHNPWVKLAELQGRLLEGGERLAEQAYYEHAVSLARALYPIVPRVKSVALTAQYQQEWAIFLEQQAEAAYSDTREQLVEQSRLQYRNAGITFARLAMLHETERQYPADVWESARCFLAGRDYKNSAVMFREYLKNESRGNRPLALVGLGEALLALDKSQEAVEAWTECIEHYPADPASYRARILSSEAYLKLGEAVQAQALLRENLDHSDLTPASIEWRDSLYALGKVMYSQGVAAASSARLAGLEDGIAEHRAVAMDHLEESFEAFDQATRLLWWAVQRHPDAPQAVEARYLLAESYRQAGTYLLEKRRDASIESIRMTMYAQAQEKYEAALTHYTQLQEELNSRQQSEHLLSDWEAHTLRNCYFARGTVLFDLQRYEEAIQAYSSATSRFQHQPEAIEAYVQIAASQRRLQRYVAARGTLEQARLVLDRIHADADFTRTTRYSREEWISLLDWLSSI